MTTPAVTTESAVSAVSVAIVTVTFVTVTIVTVAKDRREHLERQFAGIDAQTRPPDEHVIIDLGGPPIDERPRTTVIRWDVGGRALPVGEARNRGAVIADSDVLIFLDVDCVPTQASSPTTSISSASIPASCAARSDTSLHWHLMSSSTATGDLTPRRCALRLRTIPDDRSRTRRPAAATGTSCSGRCRSPFTDPPGMTWADSTTLSMVTAARTPISHGQRVRGDRVVLHGSGRNIPPTSCDQLNAGRTPPRRRSQRHGVPSQMGAVANGRLARRVQRPGPDRLDTDVLTHRITAGIDCVVQIRQRTVITEPPMRS